MGGHLEYLRQHHGTRGRVEFCGGFVGDEQPGLDRERPGHGDALLLPARKFLDELVRVSLELSVKQVQPANLTINWKAVIVIILHQILLWAWVLRGLNS